MNTVGMISVIVGMLMTVTAFQVPVQQPIKGKAQVPQRHLELFQLGILLVVVGAIIVAMPLLGL